MRESDSHPSSDESAKKVSLPKAETHFFILKTTLLTHYDNFANSLALANLVPVDEVNKAEISERGLTVLEDDILASAEEHRAQVSVRIKASVSYLTGAGEGELDMLRTRMIILTLCSACGNQLLHNLDKVHLHVFASVVVGIVRGLLNDYGAGGVMGVDGDKTVLNARLCDDFLYLVRNVVEVGKVVSGLELDFSDVN